MDCLGISSDGDRCTLDAGYGSDSPVFCMHHDEQTYETTSISTAMGDVRLLIIAADEATTDEGVEYYETIHAQAETGQRFPVDVGEPTSGHPATDVEFVFTEGASGAEE